VVLGSDRVDPPDRDKFYQAFGQKWDAGSILNTAE
jgi:hypothetical protein